MATKRSVETGVLSQRRYERLRDDVAGLVEGGQAEAEAMAGHALAVTYWRVGARIEREQLTERAGYGNGLVEQLADELGMAHATLQRAVRFARSYPAEPEPGLSWAHYSALLSVADPAARAYYEARAVEENWGRRRLREAIADRAHEGTEGRGLAAALKRPKDGNYIYRCEVRHVIDGDTLVAYMDLGFDVIKEQRVRLANVAAAKPKTVAGRAAAQDVRERLARAGTVVLKTQRRNDAHGRYVAHVFYSGEPNASAEDVYRKGTYLNGELLKAGADFEADSHLRRG